MTEGERGLSCKGGKHLLSVGLVICNFCSKTDSWASMASCSWEATNHEALELWIKGRIGFGVVPAALLMSNDAVLCTVAALAVKTYAGKYAKVLHLITGFSFRSASVPHLSSLSVLRQTSTV